MKRLSPKETKEAIHELKIERTFAEAFGFATEVSNLRYAFHRHTKHQLLYSPTGALVVETAERFYLCAPSSAVWVPAGTKHATSVSTAPLHSLFFSAKSYPNRAKQVCIFTASTLIREMIHTATAGLTGSSCYKQSYFLVLHELVSQAIKQPSWPSLARPASAELTRAVDFLLGNLDSASPALLAGEAGVSERTLRRLFQAELGITAQSYIQHARLIKAMHLLSNEKRLSITEIALAVGYANHSAFTSAFHLFTGTTPLEFRKNAYTSGS